jgi:hypothetical protein
MRQPSGHRVARCPFAAATPAPPVEFDRLHRAGQHSPLGLDALANDLQTEFVEVAERAQVRAHEGSVKHVEVFRLGGVGTPIIGRPRPSPRHRRANSYTLNPEEPVWLIRIDGVVVV